MADQVRNETPTQDRPPQPASTARTAPFDTQECTRMSSNTIVEVEAGRPVEPPTTDQPAGEWPAPLVGKATETSATPDGVAEVVTSEIPPGLRAGVRQLRLDWQRSYAETILRAPVVAALTAAARAWEPARHESCDGVHCTVRPVVAEDGRAYRNDGLHRTFVTTLAIDWGVVAQVAVALDEDDRADGEEDAEFVDLHLVGQDCGDADDSFELRLDADEADRLASALRSRAEEVRQIQRRRRQQRAAETLADDFSALRAEAERRGVSVSRLLGMQVAAEAGDTRDYSRRPVASVDHPSIHGPAGDDVATGGIR